MTSGRRTKQMRARQAQHVGELVLQAHNVLHADPPDYDKAHQLLHTALGMEDGVETLPSAGLWSMHRFDQAFMHFARSHGFVVAYVARDPLNPTRLVSGGHAELAAFVDRHLRAGIAADAAAEMTQQDPAVDPV